MTDETDGGLPAEKVDDRPNVGSATPAEYPDAGHGNPRAAGTMSRKELHEGKEYERLNPGSGSDSPPE